MVHAIFATKLCSQQSHRPLNRTNIDSFTDGHSLFFLLLFHSSSPSPKTTKKKCTVICVVEGDTALFYFSLLFVLLLLHVSCWGMALSRLFSLSLLSLPSPKILQKAKKCTVLCVVEGDTTLFLSLFVLLLSPCVMLEHGSLVCCVFLLL